MAFAAAGEKSVANKMFLNGGWGLNGCGFHRSGLRSLRAGGTLSSLGVYSGKLSVPLEPFAAGLGDHKIVTTLCPGGKERMRRLMELVRHGRLDLRPLLTHTFSLDQITDAYELFGQKRDGVIKVAIRP
jgi:threonine dehydrogenase-like Zn-dependent dehydrogenase